MPFAGVDDAVDYADPRRHREQVPVPAQGPRRARAKETEHKDCIAKTRYQRRG